MQAELAAPPSAPARIAISPLAGSTAPQAWMIRLRVPLPHRVHVLVGDRRRRDRRLQVERDEHRLDAGVGEVLEDLVLGLADPLPVPVLGERLDVRALAGDPLLRAGIAVQVE